MSEFESRGNTTYDRWVTHEELAVELGDLPAPESAAERIWVAASNFGAAIGTPTMEVSSYGVFYARQGLALDPAAMERGGATVPRPSGWDSFTVTPIFAPKVPGAAGNAVVLVRIRELDTATGVVGSMTDSPTLILALSADQTKPIEASATTVTLSPQAQFVELNITRDGAHASDTSTGDLLLLGVLLTKVS